MSYKTKYMAQNQKNDTKRKKRRIPFEDNKKFQNAISWKLLYTKLGTPNRDGATQCDEVINAIKEKHNLD